MIYLVLPSTKEVYKYIATDEFWQGILVNFTSTLIDLLLLSILIPILMRVRKRIKDRHIIFIGNFYFTQTIHRVLDVFLSLSKYGENRQKALLDFLGKGEIQEISSHIFYGNIENKLFLLSKTVQDKKFKEYSDITFDLINDQIKAINAIITEIDHQIQNFNNLPKQAESFFNYRILIFVCRDFLESLVNTKNKTKEEFGKYRWKEIDDIALGIDIATKEFFKKSKRIMDRKSKYIMIKSIFYLIFSGVKNRLKKIMK